MDVRWQIIERGRARGHHPFRMKTRPRIATYRAGTMPESQNTPSRPRVLILGGGFGGVGAAKQLEKADVDVVLVDRHDYHTFQPLLYQLATGLVETTAIGHSLRDLVRPPGQHDRPPGDCDAASIWTRARCSFDETRADRVRLPRLGLGAEVNFFGTEGADRACLPDVHAAARGAAEGSRARALGGRRPRPGADRGRRAQRRHRRRRADRRRDGGRAGRALPRGLREGLPRRPARTRRALLVEAGPELFSMFKPKLRATRPRR